MSETGRWPRVKEIFDAAVARRVEDRAAVVRDLCGGDRALQADVESLLAADAAKGSVFDRPIDPSLRGRMFSAVADVLVDETPGLAPGQQLGPYEVAGLLGAGGMGLVYRARDTTLGRDVALKILPDLWLTHPDHRARFEREARLLAALNHPNIASIYGVQEGEPAPGSGRVVKALVLELVDGETLANRIAVSAQPSASGRGLPMDDVVSYGSQVIEALEAAHERGIVHRDLKPANIKVTPEGRVKVLDFGLARAMDSTGSQIANSPTVTVGETRSGVLLGTAPYMSPEQARGKTVDKRTDIWAFGCVLYEMLAGAPAFAGDGVAEVLANVIKTEPDWAILPTDTPSALRLCLSRCLQKDPRQRFHDIADVRLAMQGAFEPPARGGNTSRRGGKSFARLAYAGWAVALVATGAFATVAFFARASSDTPETRLEIVTPAAADPLSFAISPNGRNVVFQAGQDPPRLWLRPLDLHEARPLVGTDGGAHPFWSADSASVAFTAGGVLKRIDLSGGLVRTLASHSSAGGTWSADGAVLIGSVIGPVHSVDGDRSTATEATALVEGQISHRWPQFLPDGQRFLLFTLGAPDVRGLYLGSTADRNITRLSDRESGYRFLPPAHVLLARHGGLWARRLDAGATGATILDGTVVPVAPKILVSPGFFGHVALSTSSRGSIAYRASAGESQLVWLDRTGRPDGTVGQPDDAQLRLYHLSRDGRAAVVTRTISGSTNVWLVDTERGVPRRLTFDVNDNDAILSPDGSRVAHQANGPRDGSVIFQRQSDGTGGEVRLLDESTDAWHHPQDWSADGRYILYGVTAPTGLDLRALPLAGERIPFDVARTPYAESSGRFSPDSHWVAYQSTETGQNEIYVQPFPGPGPKVQVSVGGGTLPRWRRDGAELYYLAPDRRLMAVSVAQSGARLETGPPRVLFTLSTTTAYEPSPDGKRFLVTAVVSEASPISVILNWKPPER